jgi:short-subunit dehydrogenase
MMEFSKALVTGATSGIGEALCRLLASKGMNLILTGRDSKKLDLLSQELEGFASIQTCVCDLSKREEVDTLIELIREQAPDLVINNAGFGIYGKALDSPVHEQLRILDVNARAPLEIALEASSVLKKHSKPGVILNVASAAAFQPGPGFSVYASSKAFLVLFSESLDLELAQDGIRVLVACPGMVATSFQSRAARKRVEMSNRFMMNAEYAAKQIWKQIQNCKRVYLFDWRYRLANFIAYYLIPRRLIGKIVQSSLAKRSK